MRMICRSVNEHVLVEKEKKFAIDRSILFYAKEVIVIYHCMLVQKV